MTPPTMAEQIWGLARMAQHDKIDVPASTARRELLMLKLMQEALGRGVTWAAIGTVLVGKPDGKLAKKVAKRMARDTQRALLHMDIVERG